MIDPLVQCAEEHDYQRLFIQHLNWSRPDHPPLTVDQDGRSVVATNVSSYKGLRVWVCSESPDPKLEVLIDRAIATTTTDRLLIFYDDIDQIWRWPVRRHTERSITTRLSRHRHRAGEPDAGFAAKLAAIQLPTDRTIDPNDVLSKVRAAFDVEAHNETKYASKLMVKLYTAMERAYVIGHPPRSRDHQISVTLARILFLMFGDDTDMWTPDLFRDYVHGHTARDGSDIAQRLTDLFTYVDTPDAQRVDTTRALTGFPYINGGIFSERISLPSLNADFRTAVLEACDRDWATISPAIFGSMFQSVRDAQTRRELGEHYTSEESILKTLNPLFLDNLRAELEHIRTLPKMEQSRLEQLLDKLGRIRFIDPACGCGNFIIVAYRELRDIELAILERLVAITGQPMVVANALHVRLTHFYGIEIDEWPARIAETAMFLVDRQCDLKLIESLGAAPDRLPLKEQAAIRVGNALRTDWAELCAPSADVVIAGNPPFSGQKEVGKDPDKVRDMKLVWGAQHNGYMDYVTAWYKKAADYYGKMNGRFAFVSTSSICQGQPVAATWRPLSGLGWRIRFAHRPFNWKSEATGSAGVHVVIIGMTRVDDVARSGFELFEYAPSGSGNARKLSVGRINSYLIDLEDCWILPRRTPLSKAMPSLTEGSKLWDFGHLVLDESEVISARKDPIAAKYIRPLLSNAALLKGSKRWVLWLTNSTPEDRRSSPLLRDRLHAVKVGREQSRDAEANKKATTPHLFTNIRQPSGAYIAIPKVTGHSRQYLPVAYVEPDYIANNTLFTGHDPDGLVFSVVSSRLFVIWQHLVGGHTRADTNFSNTLVWNNFPMPASMSPADRQAVLDAGRHLLDVRRDLGQPLDLLYRASTAHSGPLLEAHLELDKAIYHLFELAMNANLLEQQRILVAHYLAATKSD